MKTAKSAILCLLLFVLKMHGQNLVPNGDFEDTIRCPEDSTITKARFWYTPTIYGSPDYFYPTMTGCWSCNSMWPNEWGGGSYTNNQGYQLPHSGIAYAGAGVSGGAEFMSVQLTDTLRTGKKYCVNVYVSLANYSRSGLDLIDFAFTSYMVAVYDTTSTPTYLADTVPPDAGNQAGNFIIDTTNWVFLTDTFIAQGGEKWMTVGGLNVAQTQYFLVDSANPSNSAYYYFDDFDVHCLDCDTYIVQPPPYPEITITPNPGNGQFTINGNFPADTRLEVFNSLGQVVYQTSIPNGSQTQQVFLNLAEGVYAVRIHSGGVVLKAEKIVIAR